MNNSGLPRLGPFGLTRLASTPYFTTLYKTTLYLERMGRQAVITINQTAADADLKTMIQELRQTKGNEFWRRSESEIAKQLLEPPLKKAHEKFCAKKGLKKNE